MKPLIGLTTYREQASWGVWTRAPTCCPRCTPTRSSAPAAYPCCCRRPPTTRGRGLRGGAARRAGGERWADVDPGSTARSRTAHRVVAARPRRMGAALLTSAAAANLPTLGVCRGMQVMAVAAGGTLDQHTPDVVGHEEHSPGGVCSGTPRCTSRLVLPSILGPAVTVHCHHHQSVRSHPGYDRPPGRRRDHRGDGGLGQPVLPRRPVAPRDGPRPAALRRLVRAAAVTRWLRSSVPPVVEERARTPVVEERAKRAPRNH